MSRFSELLKNLRASRQLSLQQAADEIGITKSHLWEMEMGSSSNPRVKTLAGISSAYCVDLGTLSQIAASACIGRDIPEPPHGAVSGQELEQWALKRADDAGRLARELMRHRCTDSILERAVDFIEALTADPLLIGDDIEMQIEDVQAHARIELEGIRAAWPDAPLSRHPERNDNAE